MWILLDLVYFGLKCVAWFDVRWNFVGAYGFGQLSLVRGGVSEFLVFMV